MRKLLILTTLMSLISVTYANDTLSRAQVYSFNVGDTFDYKRVFRYDVAGIYNTSYYRLVVVGKQTSNLGDTISYTINKLPDNQIVTYRYTGLDSAAFIDGIISDTFCTNVLQFDSLQGSNILTNTVLSSCYGIYFSSYANELGVVLGGGFTFDGDGIQADTTRLIYFSKGGNTWGTPYTNFTGIPPSISKITTFHLYPNPSASMVTLSVNKDLIGQYFSIKDISGQEVLSSEIRNSQSEINVSSLSPGIYFVFTGNAAQKLIVCK